MLTGNGRALVVTGSCLREGETALLLAPGWGQTLCHSQRIIIRDERNREKCWMKCTHACMIAFSLGGHHLPISLWAFSGWQMANKANWVPARLCTSASPSAPSLPELSQYPGSRGCLWSGVQAVTSAVNLTEWAQKILSWPHQGYVCSF